MKQNMWRIFGLLLLTTLFVSGGTASAQEEGSFLGRALAGEFSGTTVTAAGPFTDQDAVKFNDTMKDFEEKTGIDIQYEGSKEFEASISIRVDAGDPPDIVDFPQPGLLANFAKQGKIVDVSEFLDMEALKGNYNQSWLDMAMFDGPDGKRIRGGVWERVNGKSFVQPRRWVTRRGGKLPTLVPSTSLARAWAMYVWRPTVATAVSGTARARAVACSVS